MHREYGNAFCTYGQSHTYEIHRWTVQQVENEACLTGGSSIIKRFLCFPSLLDLSVYLIGPFLICTPDCLLEFSQSESINSYVPFFQFPPLPMILFFLPSQLSCSTDSALIMVVNKLHTSLCLKQCLIASKCCGSHRKHYRAADCFY